VAGLDFESVVDVHVDLRPDALLERRQLEHQLPGGLLFPVSVHRAVRLAVCFHHRRYFAGKTPSD
jgi:hypothetical protein